MSESPENSQLTEEAHIVLLSAGQWSDIYRLVPGQRLDIGRCETNRIHVLDNKCSRRHCEVFEISQRWHVRDLESSNGTEVNRRRLTNPHELRDGDTIRICSTELLFTHSLDQPLVSEDAPPISEDLDSPTDHDETSSIVERKSFSLYQQDPSQAEKLRHGLASLIKLVTAMTSAGDINSLARVTLNGLFEVVCPDIGAILVLSDKNKPPVVRNLRVVAFRAPDDRSYHRVSDRLSNEALRNRDAILAIDFAKDSDSSSEFQTLAAMQARNVICVPIRHRQSILGVIHLYSLKAENSLDSASLEFTLAVGDYLGGILANLLSQSELASHLKQAKNENQSLKELLLIESDLIGESPAMTALRSEIARYAQSDGTCLVCGESGVGKELVARAIHVNSPRKSGPFVAVNCAALTESLLESELFGHEKGAFTGATERKIGKFEQAHGGTIFLDEIGEMSASMQAKFLRVLEGQPFERVGGQITVNVNVRVVAATNRDLPAAVREGEFRRDLFYRLDMLTLRVPPLRDRREDIRLLAQHFLDRTAKRLGRDPKEFTQEAIDKVVRHDWPGNVRELRNVVERAYSLSLTKTITADNVFFSDLGLDSRASADHFSPVSLAEMEKRHIEATLRFTKWVKREASRILDIERSTLDRKLAAYGINRPDDIV